MYRHGHYSEKLPNREWVVVVKSNSNEERKFFETEAQATAAVETYKQIDNLIGNSASTYTIERVQR